jgi:hypothetical protein
MLTLLQLKNSSRIQRISGLCANSDEFISLANDAVRMLMNRGDWVSTVQKVTACIYSGCITWPRGVSTPLAINMCGNTIPLSNHWYEFSEMTQHDWFDYLSCGSCGRMRGIQGDNSPVFNPISAADGTNGVYLRFYPTQPTDMGKMVTVFGVDSNGEELRSLHLDGTVQDGIETPLTLPFSTMPASDRNVNTMRHVTKIIKDETDGPLYCYQYRATDNVMLDLARYESSETNPSYTTTRLSGFGFNVLGTSPIKITALVKLDFIEAVNDNDTVQIDNLDAIALMMQGLKFGDAYSAQESVAMQALAVKELNLALRRKYPTEQIPISLSAFGTATPSRHSIGRFT